MSQLVGNALPQFTLQANDTQLHRQSFQPLERMEGSNSKDYRSSWWPGSGFVGDIGVDAGILDDSQQWYEQVEMTSGVNSRLGISGVTRDQYGSPVGSCTVKLFRTADDSLISQIVSDANSGAFLLSTPFFPDTHYVVAHKTGVPGIAGATGNTLMGS